MSREVRPSEAMRRQAQYVVEVEPGGFNQNDIARKIYKMLVDEVGDRQLVKSIASADRIARVNLSSSLAKQYMCNVM